MSRDKIWASDLVKVSFQQGSSSFNLQSQIFTNSAESTGRNRRDLAELRPQHTPLGIDDNGFEPATLSLRSLGQTPLT